MNTKSSSARIALATATVLALAACGNKGPLVMPQKPVPVEAQPAPTTPTEPTEPTEPAKSTESTEPAETPSQSTDGTPSSVQGSEQQ